MQGAHYIRATKSAVTFDDMNVHPSHGWCNRNDDHLKYREFLIKTYGIEKVERLEEKSKMFSKVTTGDMLYLEKVYKQQAQILLEEKSI